MNAARCKCNYLLQSMVIVFYVLVSSCTRGQQASKTSAKKSSPEAPKISNAASQPIPDNYSYSSVGKRDPFRPFYVDQESEAEAHHDKNLSELQNYELDQLRLVAILSGTSQPEAMFEDPQTIGHTVHVGSPIGKNNGRVSKIKKDEVDIIEESRDLSGKKQHTTVTIRLPGDELVLDK